MAAAASSSWTETLYPEIPESLLSMSKLMSIQLEPTNYFFWSHLMTNILRIDNLCGYVDGSIEPPADKLSSAFRLWRCYDAGVKAVINATLSPSALPHIVGADTARDLWLALRRRYTSMSNFNIIKLRSDLQTVSKGGDAMKMYLARVTDIRTKLSGGFSVRLDDAEMIGHTLRGLPEEYQPFSNSIAARIEPPRWHEFYMLLLAEEASILAAANH